jgi:hypothetical protein
VRLLVACVLDVPEDVDLAMLRLRFVERLDEEFKLESIASVPIPRVEGRRTPRSMLPRSVEKFNCEVKG